MGATMALISKMLNPDLKIAIYERLHEPAQESSAAWNNAGTGHSGLCEVNYTPEQEDGSIDISKAIEVCKEYEISREFWAYLVEEGKVSDPREFIHPVAHHTWVKGSENVEFLRKRYLAMKKHFMFKDMEFTTDVKKMKEWFPLIAAQRGDDEHLAATRMERGTELNFAAITTAYFTILKEKYGVEVQYSKYVYDVDPNAEIDWTVMVQDLVTRRDEYIEADHVFIGAGGGALLLLEKVEIEEKEGYGGFPVSGEWLVCKNEDIVAQHEAKVYSKAGPGAPPMSTPHLDTRYIDGKKELLFGPFAGFSPKFLKEGSNSDLFKSINFSNIPAMWGVFWQNLPLVKYLLKQLRMNHSDRMVELQKFIKDADPDDWELKVAGQRVQVIKCDEEKGGVLEFGTEIVSSNDGAITALLGASPGASTAVYIILNTLRIAFPDLMRSEESRNKLKEMVPSWLNDVTDDEVAFAKSLNRTKELLKL